MNLTSNYSLTNYIYIYIWRERKRERERGEEREKEITVWKKNEEIWIFVSWKPELCIHQSHLGFFRNMIRGKISLK